MKNELKPLSRRQRDMLNIITDALDQSGRTPSIREIADVMGVASTNGVNDHLNALIRKGYVELESGVARGVRPLRYADATPFMSRGELIAENERLKSQLGELTRRRSGKGRLGQRKSLERQSA